MVTGWGCSVTTPTSGGGLAGVALFPDEHAAKPALHSRHRLAIPWRGKKLRLSIVRPLLIYAAGLPTVDLNSASDCLFDPWVRKNCMREAHIDTAYLVEPLDLIKAETYFQSAQ